MSILTDIHSHFVYGVDDGAKSYDVMCRMLDRAADNGIGRIISTPHITPGFAKFDRDTYDAHFAEAGEYCREKGYRIELIKGAEIMYTPAADRFISEEDIPTLGDTDYVLMEFIPDAQYYEICHAIDLLLHAGYSPILAHIERYECLAHGRTAEKIKEQYRVSYQMNASTVMEKRGLFSGRHIEKWLKNGMIDFVGSDAHDEKHRPFRMKPAYDTLARKYGTKYAKELTSGL